MAAGLTGAYAETIPNFEVLTLVVFCSGVLLGVRDGVMTGAITMLVYSLLNPYGAAPPLITLSQVVGEAAPEPSSLEEIMKDAQNKDGVAVLIAAPAADVKSVRINVTMPADVLDQIDRYAEREGFTRSGFLAQAAKKAMAV